MKTIVSTQVELDAALSAKAEHIEITGVWKDVVVPDGAILKRVIVSGTVEGDVIVYGTVEGDVDVYGTAKVGSVDVYGTVEGDVIVYGTVEGDVDVYGTVEGSVIVSGTAKVGSVDVSGTVEGDVIVYGTVEGDVDVYGTVEGDVDVYGDQVKERAGKTLLGATLAEIEADHAAVLALAVPHEITALRAALMSGGVDGHMYAGDCCCLVGTLQKAAKDRVRFPQDSDRLAEKWYMAISKGHTPANNTYARLAVEWIDSFVASRASAGKEVSP